jgi:hypothetical protein
MEAKTSEPAPPAMLGPAPEDWLIAERAAREQRQERRARAARQTTRLAARVCSLRASCA